MTADKITQYLEILLDMHKTLYIQETTLTKLKQEYSSLGRKKRFSLPERTISKGNFICRIYFRNNCRSYIRNFLF